MATDPLYTSTLAALTAAIETRMGWGNGLQWATRDFEQLSIQIHERTGVQLSVITLKRVWGKIEYAGKPTITTLNALAEFAGAQNWQRFKQLNSISSVHSVSDLPMEPAGHQDAGSRHSESKTSDARDMNSPGSIHDGVRAPTSSSHQSASKREAKRKSLPLWAWGVGLTCTAAVVFYVTAFRPSGTSRGKSFSFSSKKLVDTGVPNTVIFDYDATACGVDDSVSIQQ